MRGLMQDFPLLVHRVLDHAARWHGSRPILSRSVEGPLHRTDYATVNRRSRALASAWKRARATSPERRLREKPFMAAAAESYLEKLQRARAKLPEQDQNALVVLTEELEWAGCGAYGGGVHRTTSSYRGCRVSSSHGARAGAELEIRRGVAASGTVRLLEG